MTHNSASQCVSHRNTGSRWSVSYSVLAGLERPAKRTPGDTEMRRSRIIHCAVAGGLMLGLSACTNPYDPVQRFVGGGLIGAGSGAAIGAAAAGVHGAALGAAVGGAVGAVTGLITTPPPPAYHSYYNHRRYGYYNHRHYASYNSPRQHPAGSTVTTASANSPSGY